jgi:hypothetical protein
LAKLLNLHEHFSVEKFVVPLILQDRMSIAEEYLEWSVEQQKETVKIFDDLLGQYNVNDEMSALAQ